jgi:capsular exopolysaccharide synthesis family protein
VSTPASPTIETRLRDYLQVLGRHRWVVLVVALGTFLLGTVPVLLTDPSYASTAELRVSSLQDESPFTVLPDNAQNVSRELLSEVEVLESSGLRSLVQERLGDDGPAFEDVQATAVNYSEVVEVTVRSGSPADAADVANAYAEVFVEQRRQRSVSALTNQSTELRRRAEDAAEQIAELDRQLADPALDPATRESLSVDRAGLAAQQAEFGNRADELDVEAALREGGTQIVSPASMELSPVAPQPLRTALVSIVLGLLAGIAAAVVLEVLQDRLASADDLDGLDADIPVLASIPTHDTSGKGGGRSALIVAEAYRYLRTSLRFRGLQVPARSLLITSATAGEGKTTTAVKLASVLAEAGERVVLIDADIRRPSLHKQLGLPNEAGLTTVLQGQVPLGDALRYARPNLVVLTAGPPVLGAAEMVGQVAFAKVIAGLAEQCDHLLVDAPPVLPVADSLLAARSVDGVLVVARIGTVGRRPLRATVRRIRSAGHSVVGFVANGSPADSTFYGDYGAYPLTGDAQPAAGRSPLLGRRTKAETSR